MSDCTGSNKCVCQKKVKNIHDWNQLIDAFIKIRKECSALQLVFPENSNWCRFLNSPDIIDKASHDSFFLIALERGYLSTLTEPIHRFLVNPRSGKIASRDYIESIVENWVVDRYIENDENADATLRHEKGKVYAGKLFELVFAHHLEKIGYKILDMEAWMGSQLRPDIQASLNDEVYSFEIKYIGQHREDFRNTFINRTSSAFDRYNILNYIMFRICDISFQFHKCCSDSNRIAVILLSPFSSNRFDFINQSEKFDLNCPRFYRSSNLMYNQLYIKEDEKKAWVNECLKNPKKCFDVLDGVWIFEIVTQTATSSIFEQKYYAITKDLKI